MKDEDEQKKTLLLVSRGRYRGVDIYETREGFAVCLGTYVFTSFSILAIKEFVDHWYDLKRN